MSRIAQFTSLPNAVCPKCGDEKEHKGQMKVIDGELTCLSCEKKYFSHYKECPGNYCGSVKIAPNESLCPTCELFEDE